MESDSNCPSTSNQVQVPATHLNPVIRKRPATRISLKDYSPELIKEYYREQADWYQWAIMHSTSEAEKVRRELVTLRQPMELKELELIDLEADIRSFQDMLEIYLELAGDTNPNQETQQSDCFD